MGSNLKQVSGRVSDDELKALHKLMNILGKNKAETIRYCITKVCAENGIEIEEGVTKQGAWKRENTPSD